MSKKKRKIKKIFEPKQLPQTKPVSKKVAAIALAAFSVITIVVAAVGFYFLKREMADTAAFAAFVERHYLAGVFMLIFISAVQVIFALVPGELVEVAAGYAFGAWAGALYCLIGVTIGSYCVLMLTRKFGRKFVEAFYPREKIDSLPVLNDTKKRNFLVFILFFMSGTPKDMLTYLIGITNMKIPLYLLITTFARFPSIVISTYVGGALGANKFKTAVITFAIMGAISVACFIVYSIYQKKSAERHKVQRE